MKAARDLSRCCRIGKAMYPKKKGTQRFDLYELYRLASEFDRVRTQNDL